MVYERSRAVLQRLGLYQEAPKPPQPPIPPPPPPSLRCRVGMQAQVQALRRIKPRDPSLAIATHRAKQGNKDVSPASLFPPTCEEAANATSSEPTSLGYVEVNLPHEGSSDQAARAQLLLGSPLSSSRSPPQDSASQPSHGRACQEEARDPTGQQIAGEASRAEEGTQREQQMGIGLAAEEQTAEERQQHAEKAQQQQLEQELWQMKAEKQRAAWRAEQEQMHQPEHDRTQSHAAASEPKEACVEPATAHEAAILSEWFRRMDADGNCAITLGELRNNFELLVQEFDLKISVLSDVAKVFNMLDADRDTSLNAHEFDMFVAVCQGMARDDPPLCARVLQDRVHRECFELLDNDNSGTIAVGEIRSNLSALQGILGLRSNMSLGRALRVFNKVDVDQSGVLSFDEFEAFVAHVKDLAEQEVKQMEGSQGEKEQQQQQEGEEQQQQQEGDEQQQQEGEDGEEQQQNEGEEEEEGEEQQQQAEEEGEEQQQQAEEEEEGEEGEEGEEQQQEGEEGEEQQQQVEEEGEEQQQQQEAEERQWVADHGEVQDQSQKSNIQELLAKNRIYPDEQQPKRKKKQVGFLERNQKFQEQHQAKMKQLRAESLRQDVAMLQEKPTISKWLEKQLLMVIGARASRMKRFGPDPYDVQHNKTTHPQAYHTARSGPHKRVSRGSKV